MMYAIKTPSFFRPASRPASPAPVAQPLVRAHSDTPSERAARSLNKLSLSNFRKQALVPVTSTAPSTLIQDGSYLEALSLKVSEAVSKALAQPPGPVVATGEVLNGKRPIPAGRGHPLGALIASELKASQRNVHLHRATLRQLQRPLSVLLTNLSTILLPLLSSPAFLTLPIPTVAVPTPSLNPTQIHALAMAGFAGELLESFNGLDVDATQDARGDGLKTIREGLSSLITRVVNPLITAIKNDLLLIIHGLENPNPAWTMTTTSKAQVSVKAVPNQHPAIAALQTIVPVYAKVLTRCTAAACCQTTLATVLISVVWHGLVALSHRAAPPRSSSNSAPAPSLVTSGMLRKRLGSPKTPPATPPGTPPAIKFTIKMPPSRPPSPPAVSIPTTAADARALYDLLSLLPKPTEDTDVNCVAHEAVDEAFEALAALTALLGAVTPVATVREDLDLDLLTTGLPVLVALPVLILWSGHGESSMIPGMLGLSETGYREGCLSGFGRADECIGIVGQRVVDILRADIPYDPKTLMVVKWLEGRIAH